MIRIAQLKLPCGHSRSDLDKRIRKALRLGEDRSLSYEIKRHSIDAGKKPQLFDIYTIDADLQMGQKAEKKLVTKLRSKDISVIVPESYQFPEAGNEQLTNRPVVIGAGPAGLFCALMLAEHGYMPILLERGKCVEEREADIERYWETGRLDPSSNVQFGEGGAGTFSDGKLNTQINDKTGRSGEVLRIFTEAGAPEDILYESRPHIGTDKLKVVIPAIRARILAAGGDVRFQATVTDLEIAQGSVKAVIIGDGSRIETDTVILAPGHSARDTMRSLYEKGIPVEQKAFAIGLRVSHPQSLIDKAQYGVWEKEEMEKLGLTAANYKLTARAASGRGVYSFCMCPGGYIVDASSEPGRIAVNGMSEHARDSGRANSAIVCTIAPEEFGGDHPLQGMFLQRGLEEEAYRLGAGSVPVQTYLGLKERFEGRTWREADDHTVTDAQAADTQACDTQAENALDAHSQNSAARAGKTFVPGMKDLTGDLCIRGRWREADLSGLLPEALTTDFIDGMEQFDRKIPGFAGPDAFVAGLESRTSSPVRIPRGDDLQSSVRGLYPCGEGAGYAGGIMSAAMDGIRVAEAVRRRFAEPDLKQVKKWLRKEAAAIRDAISEQERAAQSKKIFSKLTALEEYQNADVILCYYSIKSEVDTHQFLDRAALDGKRVYIPRVLSKEEMRFYLYEPEKLIVSRFGIPEPAEDPEKEFIFEREIPEKCFVVMPGLSFDTDGGRLGYGGGYYDRFLAARPGMHTCALAFGAQMREHVPADPRDVRPQRVITG